MVSSKLARFEGALETISIFANHLDEGTLMPTALQRLQDQSSSAVVRGLFGGFDVPPRIDK